MSVLHGSTRGLGTYSLQVKDYYTVMLVIKASTYEFVGIPVSSSQCVESKPLNR
jgi:hypothetical protein